MTRRSLALLLVSAVLVIAGCGSSSKTPASGSGSSTPTSTHIHFATTKFALHAGLAFGTFHHFIYAPFKAGDFSHPFSHKLTILKAVAAATFIDHEVRLAITDAKGSKLLSHVVAPLAALGGGLAAVKAGIGAAHPNAQAINSANAHVGSAEFNSSSAGQPIKETVGAP